MKRSLSVFVPVVNGQSWIAGLVSDLIEIVPEVTPRFDIVLVDDGSTDATPEIAHDLARVYPQVHLVVHPATWGRQAAMRTGLSHSSGDFVLFREFDAPLQLPGLDQLWRLIRSKDLVAAYHAGAAPLGCIPGLPPHPSRAVLRPRLIMQMTRRRHLEAWRSYATDEDWQRYFARVGLRCASVEVMGSAAGRPAALAEAWVKRASPAITSTPGPQRPNYLARLRALALGE